MGVKLTPLLIPDVTPLSELAGKRIVVDGCNLLFKYITTIRKDDQILYNREGEPVSHLIGFFYFCINLLERRIRPTFVFDGYPPEEKREKSPIKIQRLVRTWRAYHRGKVTKKALFQDPLFLYDKLIADVQEFLRLMGLPVVRGLSEGEAQGCRLIQDGHAIGMVSTDQDSLLFGCPLMLKQLFFKEEICTTINLQAHLDRWGVTRRQLVDMALLIGTDYDEGIKGIGPKKALRLIQKHGRLEDIPDLDLPFDADHLRDLFLSPATTAANPLFRAPNTRQLAYYLTQRGFNARRIDRGISRLRIAFRQLNYKQANLLAFT